MEWIKVHVQLPNRYRMAQQWFEISTFQFSATVELLKMIFFTTLFINDITVITYSGHNNVIVLQTGFVRVKSPSGRKFVFQNVIMLDIMYNILLRLFY